MEGVVKSLPFLKDRPSPCAPASECDLGLQQTLEWLDSGPLNPAQYHCTLLCRPGKGKKKKTPAARQQERLQSAGVREYYSWTVKRGTHDDTCRHVFTFTGYTHITSPLLSCTVHLYSTFRAQLLMGTLCSLYQLCITAVMVVSATQQWLTFLHFASKASCRKITQNIFCINVGCCIQLAIDIYILFFFCCHILRSILIELCDLEKNQCVDWFTWNRPFTSIQTDVSLGCFMQANPSATVQSKQEVALFSQSRSTDNGETTGVTVETSHCKRKKGPCVLVGHETG